MIHRRAEPCACQGPARLGFAPAAPETDWSLVIIAALAALLVMQALNQPRRNSR